MQGGVWDPQTLLPTRELPMAVLLYMMHELFSKQPQYDVTLLNPAGKKA